jgi:hypothetical protein
VAAAGVLALLAGNIVAADLEGLVDPTAPVYLGVGLPGAPGDVVDGGILARLDVYSLNSVLVKNNDRIAVVNNQRVRIGDRIGAATVMGIDGTGVTLDVDGETRVLGLYGEPVKTLVAGEEQ